MALTPRQLRQLRTVERPATGNRLALALSLVGTAHTEIAARAGLSDSYLSDLKAGRYQTVTVTTAHKLAGALGCRIEDLFPPEAA